MNNSIKTLMLSAMLVASASTLNAATIWSKVSIGTDVMSDDTVEVRQTCSDIYKRISAHPDITIRETSETRQGLTVMTYNKPHILVGWPDVVVRYTCRD
jgi:hypothetical protein